MKESLDHYTKKLFRLVMMVVFISLAKESPGNSDVQSAMLQLTSEYVDMMSNAQSFRKSIRWKDREYEMESGITVLMNVIRGQEESTRLWNTRRALSELGILGIQLKGHSCLGELIEAYDGASPPEKIGILHVFMGSLDPRGIPLFYRVLEQKERTRLTLDAATGLARWNVRRGVSELIELLDSEEMLPLAGTPSVAQYALRTFRMYNLRKGWGFPDDKESAEAPPDMIPPPDVAARLKPPPTAEEIKKWWSENQHRFPDWKPGDPLPGVEENQGVPDHSDEK